MGPLAALVLKSIAITMNGAPRLSHGLDARQGGAKAAVHYVFARLPKNQFVLRSVFKAYYASIDHGVLLALVRERIEDPIVMDLVGQYLHRTVEAGGNYGTRGISLGCPPIGGIERGFAFLGYWITARRDRCGALGREEFRRT